MTSLLGAIRDDEEEYLALCRQRKVEPVYDFYSHWPKLKLEIALEEALNQMPEKERPTCRALKVFTASVETGKVTESLGFLDDEIYTHRCTRQLFVAATSLRQACRALREFGIAKAQPLSGDEYQAKEKIVAMWEMRPSVIIQCMHPDGPNEITFDSPSRFKRFKDHWLGRRLHRENRSRNLRLAS